MDDILTSDDEEEEKEKVKSTSRKPRLVALGTPDEIEQDKVRSLSFHERAKRSAAAAQTPENEIRITKSEKRKRDRDNDEPRRENVRRAPRGRMNGKRN